MPVGRLLFATISEDGRRILLPVLYDGYYLYDSTGRLIWRLPDRNARIGKFSADGNSILLIGESPYAKVSLIDAGTLHEAWNFTLEQVDDAALSAVGSTAIVGQFPLTNGGWQKLLVVKDKNGSNLLSLKFGREYDEPSQLAISDDGRYVAVGTWARWEGDYWFSFIDLQSRRGWNQTVHNGARSVAMSPNASVVAAASSEALNLFDISGKLLWSASLPNLIDYVEVGVSASGEYVAVAGGNIDQNYGYAALFDRGGRKLWDFQTSSEVTAFAMDAEASRFVLGDQRDVAYVLDKSGIVLSRKILHSTELLGVVSAAVGGNPEIMVAVGDENIMYVMDAQANLLWTHTEIGESGFVGFNVRTSEDGKRILVGHLGGITILGADGNGVFSLPGEGESVPELSSDGHLLIVGAGSALTWFDVDTGLQLRNVTLAQGSTITSLSMSQNGGLAAVSGLVGLNYTFIYAFDSRGGQLWGHLDKTKLGDRYHEVSSVVVSGNGMYIAAARREVELGLAGGSGPNNGVVLFDAQGKVLWNYTTPEFVWNVAISEDGKHLVAEGSSKIFELDSEGQILWSRPQSGITAISKTGQRFVAGSYSTGELFLGNATGPQWQMSNWGNVESVAISDSGNISAAIISRDYPGAKTARLVYILDDKGHLVANYTSIGPTRQTGGSQVAVTGDGCCVLAALETDGIYYLIRSPSETQTTTNQTPSTTPDNRQIQTIATILLAAAVLVTLLLVSKRRSRTRGSLHPNRTILR